MDHYQSPYAMPPNEPIYEGPRPPYEPYIPQSARQISLNRSLPSPQLIQTRQTPVLGARQYQGHFAQQPVSRPRQQLYQPPFMINDAKSSADTHLNHIIPAQFSRGNLNVNHPSLVYASNTTFYAPAIRENVRRIVTSLDGVVETISPFTVAECTSVFDQIRDLIREETLKIEKSFIESVLTAEALEDAGFDLQPQVPRHDDNLGHDNALDGSFNLLRAYIREIRKCFGRHGLTPRRHRSSLADSGSDSGSRHVQSHHSEDQFETLITLRKRRMLALSQFKILHATLKRAIDPNGGEKLKWPIPFNGDFPAYQTGSTAFSRFLTREYREWEALWDILSKEFEQARSMSTHLKLFYTLWVPGRP